MSISTNNYDVSGSIRYRRFYTFFASRSEFYGCSDLQVRVFGRSTARLRPDRRIGHIDPVSKPKHKAKSEICQRDKFILERGSEKRVAPRRTVAMPSNVGLTGIRREKICSERHSYETDDFSTCCGRAIKRTGFENCRAGQNRSIAGPSPYPIAILGSTTTGQPFRNVGKPRRCEIWLSHPSDTPALTDPLQFCGDHFHVGLAKSRAFPALASG